MNTIKTIVVTATLLAVGYGANIVLNKPIANQPYGGEGFWDSPESFPGGDSTAERPKLTIPAFESASNSRRDNPFASDPPPSTPTREFPTNNDLSDGSAPPSLAETANAVIDRFAQPESQSVPNPSVPNLFADNRGANVPGADRSGTDRSEVDGIPGNPASSSGDFANRSAHPGVATWPSSSAALSQVPPLEPPPRSTLANQDPNSSPSSRVASDWDGHANAVPASFQAPVSERAVANVDFQSNWDQAQAMIDTGDLSGALFTLSSLYGNPNLTALDSERLVSRLDQLAGSVIFSTAHTMQAAFVANGGESLATVAQQYGVTPEFLGLVNGITSRVLAPGQSLKVVQGPFRGELSGKDRELTLFLGQNYAGRFSVEIGRDYPPQVVAFTVIEKGGPRDYVDSTTGATIAAGRDDNPYGMHWIGLNAAGASGPHLGIHAAGTSVDASDTRGCISVNASDARDLQAILSIGSEIRVVP